MTAFPSALSAIPLIDLSSLNHSTEARKAIADAVSRACRETGFFYVVGHDVPVALQERLDQLSRQFFAQDLETKMAYRMALGGPAWRGYFPVGGELTSGKPDQKEGLYFGLELPTSHPRVRAGTPLHGPNLWPPGMQETVLEYMNAVTALGHTVMQVISLSLGLSESYFSDHYTRDPLILFRIFHYPPEPGSSETFHSEQWGVGEHTDYGLLTLLRQDLSGGLQVKSHNVWIDAPPIPNSFVCNIGDMLDRMTGGLYRSTPHRVRNISGQDRYSFPLFFDPHFDAEVKPVPALQPELKRIQMDLIQRDRQERWDQASVHEFQGTYGDYLLKKVSKVFPELKEEMLG